MQQKKLAFDIFQNGALNRTSVYVVIGPLKQFIGDIKLYCIYIDFQFFTFLSMLKGK